MPTLQSRVKEKKKEGSRQNWLTTYLVKLTPRAHPTRIHQRNCRWTSAATRILRGTSVPFTPFARAPDESYEISLGNLYVRPQIRKLMPCGPRVTNFNLQLDKVPRQRDERRRRVISRLISICRAARRRSRGARVRSFSQFGSRPNPADIFCHDTNSLRAMTNEWLSGRHNRA